MSFNFKQKASLAIMVMLLASTHIHARDTAKVSGRVVDSSGAAVIKAKVTLQLETDKEHWVTFTSETGQFSFTNVVSGKHLISVEMADFTPATCPVQVTAGLDSFLTISIKPADIRDEITVTATTTPVDVFRVPGEVNIVTREEFERRQARSLDDVLRYEPGVEIDLASRRLGQSFNIRGFDSSRVLVIQDGARISQFTSGHKGNLFLDVNEIERVEVLRGPASAVYGSGALGGVINLESRKPGDYLKEDENIGLQLNSSYSSAFEEWSLTPRIFARTSDGNLSGLFGFTARRNNGIVDLGGDAGQLTRAEENLDNYNGRVYWSPTSQDQLSFSAVSYKNDGIVSSNLSLLEVADDNVVDRLTRQKTYSLGYKRNGSTWWNQGLHASLSFTDMDIRENRVAYIQQDKIGYDNWTASVRNTFSFQENQRITYGADLTQDKQRATTDGTPKTTFPDGQQLQTGVFIQDEISLLDERLSIIPGIRWDYWESDRRDSSAPTITDNKLNPKIGASFEVSTGVLLEANYAEGFRSPRFNELFISGTHFSFPMAGYTYVGRFIANEDLKPESSRNLDVGFRIQKWPVNLRANYYRSKVRDFISTTNVSKDPVPEPGGIRYTTYQAINIDDAILWGIEADADWLIHSDLLARISYYDPHGKDDNSKEYLTSIPARKLTAGLHWSRPSLGLTLGADSRLYDRLDNVPDSEDIVPGYVLFDLNASWTPPGSDRVKFSFAIDNIADRGYTNGLFYLPGTARDFRFGIQLKLAD